MKTKIEKKNTFLRSLKFLLSMLASILFCQCRAQLDLKDFITRALAYSNLEDAVYSESCPNNNEIFIPSGKEITATIQINNDLNEALSVEDIDLPDDRKTLFEKTPSIECSNNILKIKFKLKPSAEPNVKNNWKGEKFTIKVRVNKASGAEFAKRDYTFYCNTKPTLQPKIETDGEAFKVAVNSSAMKDIHEDLKHGRIEVKITSPSGKKVIKVIKYGSSEYPKTTYNLNSQDLYGSNASAGAYTCIATLYDAAGLTAGESKQVLQLTPNDKLGKITYSHFKIGTNDVIYVPSEEEITATIDIDNSTNQPLTVASITVLNDQDNFEKSPKQYDSGAVTNQLKIKFKLRKKADAITAPWKGETISIKVTLNKASGVLFAEKVYTINCNTEPSLQPTITPTGEGFKVTVDASQMTGKHEDLKHGKMIVEIIPPAGSRKEAKTFTIDGTVVGYQPKTYNLQDLFGPNALAGAYTCSATLYDVAGLTAGKSTAHTRLADGVTIDGAKPLAWANLKKTVADNANVGKPIYVEGLIQATNKPSNSKDIEITKDITIIGKTNAVLDAATLCRVFAVESGGSLTLKNITLKNGKAPQGSAGGGAVRVGDGGTFNAHDVKIADSKAGNTKGGAIFAKGTVTLNKTTIENCTAKEGAGVYVSSGTTTLTNTSLIQKCIVGVSDGGIYVEKTATVTGNDSTISGCSAKLGRAIKTEGTMTITGGKILSNTATQSASHQNEGGGIYLLGGDFTATDLTVEDCHAKSGGGIYLSYGAMTLKGNSTIKECKATENGAGICAFKGFTISGGVKIDSKNNVYLANNSSIHIIGSLNEAEVAMITPATYGDGTPV